MNDELTRRSFLGSSAGLAAGAFVDTRLLQSATVNPYALISPNAQWLRGEVHTHVESGPNGAETNAIYASAHATGLDFVALSREVTEAAGGAERFGETDGDSQGVIAIEAREIQNNLYGQQPYFPEPGAAFLHVLTVGRDGISICAHPRFYDMAGGERDSWDGIRSALLQPDPDGPLAALNVEGLEIYNGYTLSVLQSRRQQGLYAEFDENCWDELLVAGRRMWGFAANDAFVDAHDYGRFAPLGCVYAASAARDKTAIVAALRAGRFYSSTGVRLAPRPLSIVQSGGLLTLTAEADQPVEWTAIVYGRAGYRWRLDRLTLSPRRRAAWQIAPDFRYFRIQCRKPDDPWQRAWLQPVINPALFAS